MTAPRYTCPACGLVTFTEPPGSYDLCSVCGWEDDAVQLANPTSGGGANHESLVEAQIRAREVARDHPRDPSWRELSEREIAWHRSERGEAGMLWPNPADGIYYWRSPFEPVHSMADWYDGPLAGIAEFGGRPHRFRRRWDADADEYAINFELEPIPERVAALEAKLWALWLRWLDACQAGHADLATHPCLPEERALYDVIKGELGVLPTSAPSHVATAVFRGDLRRCTHARVQWTPVEGSVSTTTK